MILAQNHLLQLSGNSMSYNDPNLKITDEIKSLNLDVLDDNLYYYEYKTRHILSLIDKKIDKESSEFIGPYSSFIGAVYENIIYEHLIRYSLTNDYITKFILKGPHQDNTQNIKNGFLIDPKSQIVFKSGYKDISEFDAMFMTKDALFFVESTVVKNTLSLKKRLKKKVSLLKILFPKIEIKCLIVVTKEAMGTHLFPDYCTIWTTDVLNVTKILSKIKENKKHNKKPFKRYQHKKLKQIYDIQTTSFKYFSTMRWIINSIKKRKNTAVDVGFLKSKQTDMYYEIYGKIIVGYIHQDQFKKLFFDTKVEALEKVLRSKIEGGIFYVAVEKTYQENFQLIYFCKIIDGKLKKIDPNGTTIKISDKQPKGFTYSEIKFLKYLFQDKHELSFDDVVKIKKEL